LISTPLALAIITAKSRNARGACRSAIDIDRPVFG
jgi:hypothetical protein